MPWGRLTDALKTGERQTLVIGIARLSNNWLLSRLAAVYVEVLRDIPLLLQLPVFLSLYQLLRSSSFQAEMLAQPPGGESFTAKVDVGRAKEK